MEIKQLGNGGGLDLCATNSSFLIKLENNRYILIDCGRNVVDALYKLEKDDENFEIAKIMIVIITHMHDDHIGSLQTLLYRNYYVNGVTTKVMAGQNSGVSEYLKGINKTYIDSEVMTTRIADLRHVAITECSSFSFHVSNGVYHIKLFPVYHKVMESYGVLINRVEKKDGKYRHIKLMISGDTKANRNIEQYYKDETMPDLYKQADKAEETVELIYHDFSNWDVPSCNVHACQSDFEAAYSDEFKSKVIRYHNDEEFDTRWVEL